MRHKLKSLISVLSFFCGLASSASSQAALYDRGGGLIYDDVLNVTWLQDANLLKSLASQDTNLINKIVSAVPYVYDTPNQYTSYPRSDVPGRYSLHTWDLNGLSGQVSWWGAQAFTQYLNKVNYSGFNNWRLPLADSSCYGSNCINSELGQLYYEELGNTAGTQMTKTGIFNIDSLYVFWTGTEAAPIADYAWLFTTGDGGQYNFREKSTQYFAWVVRSGDITPVPIPASAWLFGSAILGLITFRKQST